MISASAGAKLDENGLTFKVRVEPHGSWSTDLDVVTAAGAGGNYVRPKYSRDGRARPNMERSLERWLDDAPRLECDWDPLKLDVSTQPRRPRRTPVLAAGRGAEASPLQVCRGS